MVRKSPSGKPRGPRLYYPNAYLGSVGVHLSAPVRNWLESLPGLLGRGTDPNNAWTINLQTKEAALPTTHHFLAMVKMQYKLSVQAWMSDVGGEYTSMAFTTMMKEKGITVLQSVPHVH